MAKKRNRTKRQKTGDSTGRGAARTPAAGGASRSKKKRKLSGASLAFIALIVLAAVAIAIANMFGDRPDCPPGQVWSEAHNHCH